MTMAEGSVTTTVDGVGAPVRVGRVALCTEVHQVSTLVLPVTRVWTVPGLGL